MKYLEKNKGITLIALIITIIVLLILAGVTINAISGNESAMDKATEAKEKNDESNELEDVKISVVNAIANGLTGLVEDNALKDALQGKNYALTNNNDGTWTITGQKASYIVASNGTITQVDGLSIIENLTMIEETVQEIKVKKYGKALDKEVNWSKEGNVIFVTDITGTTELTDNPIGETIYVKSGKKTNGISGKIRVSALEEESKSCNITIKEDKYLGEARQTDKYGYKVNGYDAQLSEVDCWRLFYQDDYNTFLIAHRPQGDYVPSRYYAADDETRYTTGKNVSDIGKKLNLKYYKAYPNDFTLTDGITSMRAVAWMTDTNNSLWSKYVTEDAKWAIASPTIELYMESYNAVKENIDKRIENGEIGLISRTVLSEPTIKNKNGTYGNGYTCSWGTYDEKISGYNHGIYNFGVGKSWIASPYDYYGSRLFTTGHKGYGMVTGNVVTESSFSVRPIVCLQTSTFNEAVTNGTYTLTDE